MMKSPETIPTATLSSSSSCGTDYSTMEVSLDEDIKLKAAKSKLKTALQQYKGSTKNAKVMQAINELAVMNPTKNAAESPLLLGEFIAHTSPDFPGRIKPEKGLEDVVQYTLGRLSFGIFQPHHLKCTIRSVRNSIIENAPDDDSEAAEAARVFSAANGNCKTFSYPIQIDLTIHTPQGDLPATMCHSAIAYVIPEHPDRLGVTFCGGSLAPTYAVRSDPELMTLWTKVFDHAYSKAEEERSFVSSVLQYIFKKVFQLSTPTDDDLESNDKHAVSFAMKRSPRGYWDVLYLDEDIRITRGNRGTIIVVERVSSAQRVFAVDALN